MKARPGLALVMALVLSGPARAQDAADARLLDLFGPLGLPGVNGKTFVELDVGWWWEGNGSWSFTHRRGWLLSVTDDEVEFLDDQLDHATLRRLRRSGEDWERPRSGDPPRTCAGAWRELDFEAACREVAREPEPDPATGYVFELRDMTRLGAWTEPVVFGRWARERGREQLASELVGVARRRHAASTWTERPSLEDTVANELSVFVGWHAIGAACAGEDRQALLDRWTLVAEKLPPNPYTPRARAMVEAYRSLLEDEGAAPREGLAQWIHALRDARGERRDALGPSPIEELVRLGWAAIPELIETIGDARPSRWLPGSDKWTGPADDHLLTIGDCALVALHTITGACFSPAGYLPPKERVAQTQRAARAWWAEAQAKGEQGTLLAQVAEGEGGAPALARQALARWPGPALDAVARGLRASAPYVRAELVAALAELPGDAPVALLRAELADGLPIASRVRAAAALRARGSEEGFATVVEGWERCGDDSSVVAFTGLCETITFLAASGSREGLAGLGRGLSRRAPSTRGEVLDALADAPRSDDDAWERAVEDLLAACLADDGETCAWRSCGDLSIRSPRVGDLAAWGLARRWPGRYAFSPGALRLVRDRQRITAANAWRRARGLELLPEPAREVVALSLEAVAPLVASLGASTAQARTDAVAALERLGLPGLVPLERLLTTLPPDWPGRAEGEALVRRLSCVVADVAVVGSAFEPAWRGHLEALRGRTLDPVALLALVEAAARGEAGARRVRVAVTRPGDGSGVVLEAEAGAEPAPARNGWSLEESARLGSEELLGDSMDSSMGPCSPARLRRPLERCLASTPETSFEVEVTVEAPAR